jgi:hypothetical protein
VRVGPSTEPGLSLSAPAPNTQHRTIIEVIDPKTRRVVARKTVDGFVSDVISANRVVSFVENEDGTPIATVWDLALIGGN